MRAVGEAMDFRQLFVGMACVLMLSALILTGLLASLGVAHRREEVGVLRAAGFSPRQVAFLRPPTVAVHDHGDVPGDLPAGAETLEQRVGLAGTEAPLLAALAGGSLARALTLREGPAADERDQALALLWPALKGDPVALWKAVQGMNNYGRAGREVLRRMVEFHQLWLRDLMRARYGAPSEKLINYDRADEIRAEAERIEPAEIRRRLMVLEEMLRTIEGNVTPELAMFSALARLTGKRFGGDAWPPHPTARWDY